MDIEVTLFGGLRHYLPTGSSFNKCKLSIDEGSSLDTLLQQIPIPADKPYLVMFNDTKLNADQYASTKISGSDDIVLLPPIKGG